MKKSKFKSRLLLLIALCAFLNLKAQNNALNFDGVDNYVISSSALSLSGSAITIEAWVYINAFQTTYPYISQLVGEEGSSDAAFLRLGDASILAGNQVQFVLEFSGAQVKLTSGTALKTGIWYHIAGTYDGAYMRIYINGVENAFQAQTGSFTASTTFMLGATFNPSLVRLFNGKLDEVRIWTDARTELEIRQHMYKELVPVFDEVGLNFYYKLNETGGTIIYDGKQGGIHNSNAVNTTLSDEIPSSAFYGPKNCLNFNTSNAYAVRSSPVTTVTGNFTMMVWFKVNVVPTSGWTAIVYNGTDAGGYGIGITSAGKMGGLFGGVQFNTTTAAVSTGIWYHLTMRSQSGITQFFLNGKLLSYSTTTVPLTPVNRFTIGNMFSADNTTLYNTTSSFNGLIDEVRVYDTALTDAQISENMYKSLVGDETFLIAYYNFDNSEGGTLQSFDARSSTVINLNLINMASSDWVSSTAFNTWLNTNSSTWATAANWSDGATPTATDNIGVYNYSGGSNPTISSTSSNNNLIIATGATLTVSSHTLTSSGNILNNGTLSLTGGQLNNNGTASIFTNNGTLTDNGTITFKDVTNNSGKTITLNAGKVLTVSGNLTNNGTLSIAGTLTNNGTASVFTNNGTLTDNGTITFKDVTNNSGKTITLNAGKALTVSGNLTNNGTFTINSDATTSGSLIISGTASGNITYNRYLTSTSSTKWHLIAAPVGAQSINTFVTTGANNIATSGVNYSVTPYDNTVAKATTGTWGHWTSDGTGAGNVSTAGNFTPGKGYEILTTADGTVAFTGTVPVANVNIAVTKPSSANAWNLIGNPFPSSIFANSNADATNNFITVNSAAMDASYQAIYLWNPGTSTYDLINQATTGAVYIAPGQAFFVKSVTAGATVSFTTAMRTNQSTVTFQKITTPATPDIVLSADNNTGKISTTAIKYIAGKSLGLDPGYDAGLFDASGGNFSLYTKLVADNGVKFMLQVLPDDVYDTAVIPIGLDANAGTQITFTAQYSNLPIGKKVFLEDRLLNTLTQINNTDKVYTLTLNTQSQGAGRFYLHTLDNASTLGIDDYNKLKYRVIANPKINNLRIIGNVEQPAVLDIYDTLGRHIKNIKLKTATDQNINISNLAGGIYILKVKTKNSQFNTKIAWY